jgi:hypothetical protein
MLNMVRKKFFSTSSSMINWQKSLHQTAQQKAPDARRASLEE